MSTEYPLKMSKKICRQETEDNENSGGDGMKPSSSDASEEAEAQDAHPSLFDQLPEEVREEVFKLLDAIDLLQCRLVCRQWKVEASSVLRMYKRCYAVLKEPCRDLVRLNVAMGSSEFDMINGLSLHHCDPPQTERSGPCAGRSADGNCPGKADMCASNSVDRLGEIPFKFISVQPSRIRHNPSLCSVATTWITNLVWTSRQSLEELDLHSKAACACLPDEGFDIPAGIRDGEQELKNVSFPRLQRIVLRGLDGLTDNLRGFLVSAAPNLQRISTVNAFKWDWGPYFDQVVDKITQIFLRQPPGEPIHAIRHQLEKCAQGKRRAVLEQFAMNGNCYMSLAPSVIELLDAGRDTLEYLCVCPFLLVQAMETLGPGLVFSKVERLDLDLPVELIDHVFGGMLRKINMSRTFPMLQEVFFDARCAMTQQQQPLALGVENLGDDLDLTPSDGVHRLVLFRGYEFRDTVEHLSHAFPNITRLDIEWTDENLDVAHTFVAFPNLKSLYVKFEQVYQRKAWIDAVLCGLTMEEADLLQDLSKDELLSLKDLVVVPIRPSMTYLQDLDKFELYIELFDSTWLISQVSGVLAFSRIPSLHAWVTVPPETQQQGFTGLSPYVAEIKYDPVEEDDDGDEDEDDDEDGDEDDDEDGEEDDDENGEEDDDENGEEDDDEDGEKDYA